jgi:hypothetical protein
MPSVRVKGKTYTPVQELFANADVHGAPEEDPPNDGRPINRLFPRFSHPFLRQDRTPTATLSTPARPRALTAASRVHAHCTLRTPRGPEGTSRSPNRPSIALPPNERIHSGEFRESERSLGIPRMRSYGGSARADSSINLSHGGDDLHDVRSPDHHDDVVEHLDVIGIRDFFYSHGY